jgi:hypothetical protein
MLMPPLLVVVLVLLLLVGFLAELIVNQGERIATLERRMVARDAAAVKSEDFESVYFVSADLQGPGLEGTPPDRLRRLREQGVIGGAGSGAVEPGEFELRVGPSSRRTGRRRSRWLQRASTRS